MGKILWKVLPDSRIKGLRTANSFHVKGDNKYARSVQRIVFMITGERIPSITKMSTDEYGLRSMQEIDPVNLRMSSRQWEKLGLLPSGKALDHASMFGNDLPMRKMQGP